MIVMVVPDITNPFFPGVVREAEDIAFQSGFCLVLCNSDNDFTKESSYLRINSAPGSDVNVDYKFSPLALLQLLH